jgi:hypothetical protein
MIIAVILVIFALLSLSAFLWLAKGRIGAANPAQLAGKMRPVDVDAFRNLTDPAEELYLRENLRSKDFKSVHRERLRAALEYVFCVAGNATLLVRMGEAARHSPDPSVAAAGERLVESALRLRILAFQAIAKLYVGLVFTGIRNPYGRVADGYERMTSLVFSLGRLQHAGRSVSAAL